MTRTPLAALAGRNQSYAGLDELCAFAPREGKLEERVFWFVQLVRWLRGNGHEKRGLRLRYLQTQLEQHPEWRENIGAVLSELARGWDCEQLLGYGGIARDFHPVGRVGGWL